MDAIYIVAIAVSSIILLLLIICFVSISKKRSRYLAFKAEMDAVYSDPNLAKMEYDIAFYEDDLPGTDGTLKDRQVTIDDVVSGKNAQTAGENAIFTKADDGMEEIAGHYQPEK